MEKMVHIRTLNNILSRWSRILQIVFKFNEKSRRMESNWTYLEMQHFAVSQKDSVISLRSTKPDQEWNKKEMFNVQIFISNDKPTLFVTYKRD